MDPVLRAISDTRRLRSKVANPFDKSALIEYLCNLAVELGFTPVKYLRHRGVRIDCGWKDGSEVFLAANIEFGNEREILGAIAEMLIVHPEIGMLITASNPLKPITNIMDSVKSLKPDFDVVILDVRTGNAATIRGK